jgi:hypothetical protein
LDLAVSRRAAVSERWWVRVEYTVQSPRPEEDSMKKTMKPQKLSLSGQTIRRLAVTELRHAVGGLSGERCSLALTGCGECEPRNTLYNTACNACVQTDGCTYTCTGFPCQYP